MIVRLSPARYGGSTLVIVVLTMAVVSVLIGSVLCRTSTNTVLSRRVTEYNGSASAALAASEKVVAKLSQDYLVSGEAAVSSNVANYCALVPTVSELLSALNLVTPRDAESIWSKYQFTDISRQTDRTSVYRVSAPAFTNVAAGLPGLRGNAATYRIVSNAKQSSTPYTIVSAVAQDVQVASIPVFQFQVFYVPDLEINPGSALTLSGRAHGNKDVYLQPAARLTFQNHLTAGGKVIYNKHPQDPVQRTGGSVVHQGQIETRNNTLNFPIGAANTPANLRAFIEPPPLLESASSALGKHRFYNKADMIIRISGSQITATSGIYNLGLSQIPWISTIVSKGARAYNKRESKTVVFTDVDLAQFNARYGDLTALLGRQPRVVYIVDEQDPGPGLQSGIRLLSGASLPAAGLTIATPDPLYVQGNYNLACVPACLAGDAVTVLSTAWNDTNGAYSLSARIAANTTINAAVIAGIVPTGSGSYSGGCENSLRLLEDWSGKTFTFKGAIAVLYYSQDATAPWGGPDVYGTPQRDFTYNTSFLDLSGLPPGTPEMRTIVRSGWATVKPHSTL